MVYLSIAGMTLRLNECSDSPVFRPYILPEPRAHDVDIVIRDTTEFPDVDVTYRDQGLGWGLLPDGRIFCDFVKTDYRSLTIVSDPDWTEVVIYKLPTVVHWELFIRPALEIVFRNASLMKGMLMIHSSAISVGGCGIAFSAQSGVGKSTQSNLWVEHAGATIINGDRPTYKVINGVPYVCGSLWCGSSNAYTNDIIPLKALIFIERHTQNRIRELAPQEVLPFMLPRCFLPYYSDRHMALAMNVVDKLLESANFFLLRCLPDAGAVKVVQQCIMTNRKF